MCSFLFRRSERLIINQPIRNLAAKNGLRLKLNVNRIAHTYTRGVIREEKDETTPFQNQAAALALKEWEQLKQRLKKTRCIFPPKTKENMGHF